MPLLKITPLPLLSKTYTTCLMPLLCSDHRDCCIKWNPSGTHLKLRSCEISLAHKLLFSCQTVLKFLTEHGTITTIHSANFQSGLITEMGVMDERNIVRFEYKLSFGWVVYCNSHLATLYHWRCQRGPQQDSIRRPTGHQFEQHSGWRFYKCSFPR